MKRSELWAAVNVICAPWHAEAAKRVEVSAPLALAPRALGLYASSLCLSVTRQLLSALPFSVYLAVRLPVSLLCLPPFLRAEQCACLRLVSCAGEGGVGGGMGGGWGARQRRAGHGAQAADKWRDAVHSVCFPPPAFEATRPIRADGGEATREAPPWWPSVQLTLQNQRVEESLSP